MADFPRLARVCPVLLKTLLDPLPGPLVGSLLALTALTGCVSDGSSGAQPIDVEGVAKGRALVVHQVYSAAFEAIEAALGEDDLAVADATLRRLQGRLAIDGAHAVSMADARFREDDMALRTMSGEVPSAENVEAALKMAEGFERVIEGRNRLNAVELSLELVRLAGQERVKVVLVATSEWTTELHLEPGAGRMEILRSSLEPRMGSERRDARITALERGVVVDIPAGGTSRTTIAEAPVEVPVGSIATRMEATVEFNGGTVSDGDLMLPMREIVAGPGKRTDFPVHIPAGLVEPLELVELAERGNAPLPAILERAIRIAPSRRAETLDRLGKAARTMPIESFRVLVPAIRWIVGTNEFGRDEGRWRDWLISRYEERYVNGQALGG